MKFNRDCREGTNSRIDWLCLALGSMVGIGGLGWAYLGGLIAAGQWTPFAALMFAGVPLLLVWGCVGLPRILGFGNRLHWPLFILGTLAVLTLYRQPWNARNGFVFALQSIPYGATPDQVKRHMSGYLGGQYGALEELYVPEQLKNLGITHGASYRWNDTDGRFNADVGHVYFRKGAVVATDFSPD